MTEESPENIALALLEKVMRAENKTIDRSDKKERADRQYILDTYIECLAAAQGRRRASQEGALKQLEY